MAKQSSNTTKHNNRWQRFFKCQNNYQLPTLDPLNKKNSSWKYYARFLLLFCGIFLTDQFTAITFVTGYHLLNPWIGLILALIIGTLLWIWIFNFNVTKESLTTLRKRSRYSISAIVFWSLFIGYAATILWAMIGSTILRLPLNGKVSHNQAGILTFFHSGPAAITFIFIFGIIIGTAVEELIFRTMMINPQAPVYQQRIEYSTSIIVFALSHMLEQNGAWTQWLFNFGQYAIIGIILGYLYYHYHNYRLNYLVHASWNALALIMAILA